MRKKVKEQSIWQFFVQRINELQFNHQFATARHYQSTMHSLQTFWGMGELTFSQLNHQLVQSYNEWLRAHDLQMNTISFYNRILRALCSTASHQGIHVCEEIFDGIYTRIPTTRKRAVELNTIHQLMKCDLSDNKTLQLVRDLFLFSFMAQGMAFIDLVYLRHQDVHGEYLTYCRRKTGRQVFVYLEPIMLEIINRHTILSTQYLFPILNGSNASQTYKQYQKKLTWYNLQLKVLSKRAKLNIMLSSYVARHSWATSALRCNTPIGIISEAMGHATERTTRIYLSTFQKGDIARANKKIIDKLVSCSLPNASR